MKRLIFPILFLLAACMEQDTGVVSTLPTTPADNGSGTAITSPLRVGPTGRYLTDGTGEPVFISGDSPWSLIVGLRQEDVEVYLADRQQKGFNLLMVNLIEHQFSPYAPANMYRVQPFTDRPFVSPNELYFKHADEVLQAAAEKGIYILLDPVYLGYNCGSQGWCDEISSATLDEMRQWGRYLGQRYGSYTNIVWLIGGDTNPSATLKSRLRETVYGIQESDNDALFTAHNAPGSMAISPWGTGESWLTLNNFYSYSTTLYSEARQTYAVTPTMPFVMLESMYENERGVSTQQLRAQAYWSILSGACGHMFGNNPIWLFGSGWQSALNEAGSKSMEYMQRLFVSRYWHTLQPDFNHGVLTAGYGAVGTTSYATAAANKTSIIAYLPSRREVSVNTSVLDGEFVNAWWYNPSDGSAIFVGSFAKGNMTITPPSTGDWVLVVDDASQNFPAPGGGRPNTDVPPPPSTPAAPSNLVASPTSASAVTISWTDNSRNETGFRLERSVGAEPFILITTTTGTSFSDEDLNASTVYTYKVKAFNADGESAYSNEDTAKTYDAEGPVPMPPQAPSNLLAQGSSSSTVEITWDDNSTNELGFKLERTTGSGSFAIIATLTGTHYTDSNLPASTVNSYRVKAYNAAGESAYSNEDTAGTFDENVPPPPSGECVMIGNTVMNMTWDDQDNWLNGFQFTATEDGTLDVLSIYVASGTGGKIALAIYTNVYDTPRNLIEKCAEITSSVEGWNTAPLEQPVEITAGTTYWICMNTNASNLRFGLNSGGGLTVYRRLTYTTDFPRRFGRIGGWNRENWTAVGKSAACQ